MILEPATSRLLTKLQTTWDNYLTLFPVRFLLNEPTHTHLGHSKSRSASKNESKSRPRNVHTGSSEMGCRWFLMSLSCYLQFTHKKYLFVRILKKKGCYLYITLKKKFTCMFTWNSRFHQIKNLFIKIFVFY